MALHRRIRWDRIMGSGRRPECQDIDRCVRALSGAGLMSIDPQAAWHATSALPDIPRDQDGPVFREPWEAQAFAMALALRERGLFTWTEWPPILAKEIKRPQESADPPTAAPHYRP